MSLSNKLLGIAKRQAKKAFKELTKPAPKSKRKKKQQAAPEIDIEFDLGNNVHIRRNGRDWFDGEIIAEREDVDMYLAEGWCGESTYLVLLTSSEIIKRKKYESMSEYAIITPDGIGVVTDGDDVTILTREKTSTRSFNYYESFGDEAKVINDEVFAYVREDENDTVTLRCFRVNDQTTWSKKIKYNGDDYLYDQPDRYLTLTNGVFEVTLPDGTTQKYTIDGNKLT